MTLLSIPCSKKKRWWTKKHQMLRGIYPYMKIRSALTFCSPLFRQQILDRDDSSPAHFFLVGPRCPEKQAPRNPRTKLEIYYLLTYWVRGEKNLLTSRSAVGIFIGKVLGAPCISHGDVSWIFKVSPIMKKSISTYWASWLEPCGGCRIHVQTVSCWPLRRRWTPQHASRFIGFQFFC